MADPELQAKAKGPNVQSNATALRLCCRSDAPCPQAASTWLLVSAFLADAAFSFLLARGVNRLREEFSIAKASKLKLQNSVRYRAEAAHRQPCSDGGFLSCDWIGWPNVCIALIAPTAIDASVVKTNLFMTVFLPFLRLGFMRKATV